MVSFTNIFTGSPIAISGESYQLITMTGNVNLSWPVVDPQSPNVVTSLIKVDSNNSGNLLIMPDARESSTGASTLITNSGANNVPVVNVNSGAIATILPGQSVLIALTDNSTDSGAWYNVILGTATSSPDAASLAGQGLLAISTTLNGNYPVTVVNASRAITITDRCAVLNCSAGNITLTLPAASSLASSPNGFFFWIYVSDSSGQVTLSSSSGALINGSSSFVFNPGDTGMVVTDGTNWFVIGYGIPTFFNVSVINIALTDGTSPRTLTSTEVQYNVQNFTSTNTLTGTYTINYPAVEGIFYVSNQTTGSQNLILQRGGNSYTLPPNQRAILYSDGTNLYSTPTTIPSNLLISQTAGTANALQLQAGNNFTVGLKAPNSGTANINYTFPGSLPSANSYIYSNNAGLLSFTNAISGTFRATLSSNQSISNNTLTTIAWDSSTIGASYLNLSTGTYTAPVTGNYFFTTTFIVNVAVTSSDTVTYTISFNINGAAVTQYVSTATVATTLSTRFSYSNIMQVNSGETVTISILLNATNFSTASVTGTNTVTTPYFTGFCIQGT